MDVYWSLSYWFFQPQFWLIIGILLVTIDIFLLGSSFLLPIGISALIVSVLVYFDTSNVWEFQLFDTWRKILLYFGILSVVSIFIIKIFIKARGDKGKDINQY
jgi:membrane protein implicated in regulation of membrane protease activity